MSSLIQEDKVINLINEYSDSGDIKSDKAQLLKIYVREEIINKFYSKSAFPVLIKSRLLIFKSDYYKNSMNFYSNIFNDAVDYDLIKKEDSDYFQKEIKDILLSGIKN